jgi:hypothetical protein
MRNNKFEVLLILIMVSALVFIISFFSLIYGDQLETMFNVIGIRIATLIVAYASFGSTSTFSYLIYIHNRTARKANDDANKRAELFRELQFASTNYSIIEFFDRMLIYNESPRYIERFTSKKSTLFHMMDENLSLNDIIDNPSKYYFITLRIPFKLLEGKVVADIAFETMKFERNGLSYRFIPLESQKDAQSFILYNEFTHRNNTIMNVIFSKESVFFNPEQLNDFSKIKIRIKVTSLLGVVVKGISELYFTNPEKRELDGSFSYKINSSNFKLTEMPKINEIYHKNII